MPEIIECPYLPEGFIAMKDVDGISVMNVNTGYVIRIPSIEYELRMPDTFRIEEDRAIGTMKMLWRLRTSR